MAKMKFELNRAGVSRLLKSPEMRSVIEANAASVQKNAGDLSQHPELPQKIRHFGKPSPEHGKTGIPDLQPGLYRL